MTAPVGKVEVWLSRIWFKESTTSTLCSSWRSRSRRNYRGDPSSTSPRMQVLQSVR